MDKMIARLKEPSTHASIAAILAGTGWLSVSEADLTSIIGGVAMIATALAGIFLKEAGADK